MGMPLEGVRVLDFTHGVAGPYATMLLGDLGCDVIKLEKPGRGEPSRYMNVSRKFVNDIPGVGGDYFLAINRNKRALTVDLKKPESREICFRLAAWADIAVQSFRPGLMDKIGLGYDALKKINPRIIYANLTGYGRAGPLADKPAMDVAVQARSGIMRMTGAVGSDEPIKTGSSLADFGGGIFLTTAIVSALFARERTGVGQEVDVSLYGATMSMLSNFSVAVMDGDADLKPMGSGHPQIVPYQSFPTADGAIVIATGTNKSYRQLCTALGREDLGNDPRFATNDQRVVHRSILVPMIAAITPARTTADWERILTEAGLPCAPVRTIKEAFSDPQLKAIGMVETLEHPKAGKIRMAGVPFQFGAASDNPKHRPPPMLGEHTDEVLRDVLGFSEAEVANLRRQAVV